MLYASLYQFVVNNNSVKTLLIMYIHLFPSKLKHIFLSFKNKHKIWRKKSKIFLGKSIFSFAKVHIYKIKYMHVYVNKSIILLDITNFVLGSEYNLYLHQYLHVHEHLLLDFHTLHVTFIMWYHRYTSERLFHRNWVKLRCLTIT